ncbi:TonB-dependent receptor [Mucilaginibacter kameinonensis]|uniref:TonB-dependent receptor n=1 Tax=Mucilaginibacter kameinonensis TaxID=452286 RepID=UPI0013CED66E|nr:TonB-dependent receptor [Mucilaginibacter kameinonensis]
MKPLNLITILTAWLSFQFNAEANAQGKIQGTITDEHKLPLPSVIIRLLRMSDSVLYTATTSDQTGKFHFNQVPEGRYLLNLSFVGFRKAFIPDLSINKKDTTINIGEIKLLPASNMLGEVIIEAQTPHIQKLIDKTIINVDRNIANTGTNVLELIKKLPGVQVTPDGQITLNGHSGINIMLDGRSTYLSAEDLSNLLTGMSSNDIQKIEIMTNPSAKYDAAGTAGIINIVHKKNTQSGLNGNFNGGFGVGTYNRYNSGSSVSYKTKKYSYYINGSYFDNKTLLKGNAINNILQENAPLTENISATNRVTAGTAYNAAAGLDLYLRKGATLTLLSNISTRRTSEAITSSTDIFNHDQTKTGSEAFNALNRDKPFNYMAGIQLQKKLDTLGKQWSAGIDYSSFIYKPLQQTATTMFNSNGDFQSQENILIDESRRLYIVGAKADYVLPLINHARIETGFKSSYVKTNNENNYYQQADGYNMIDPQKSDYSTNWENINAAYINFNGEYGRLSLQGGLRAEQTVMKGHQLIADISINRNYVQLFPTLFANYKLGDQSTLNFQFGRRTNRPDYHELVPFRRPLSSLLYFQGNPFLQPEQSWHQEITWAYQNSLFLTAAYETTNNYVRTLPYLDQNSTTMTRIPTNVQGAHFYNFSMSYDKDLLKWLTTNTSITLYKNSFTGNVSGFSLNDPGINTVDIVSNNTFRCTDKLSMEADWEYESKRRFIGSTYGGYTTLNLVMKQKLFHNKAAITINAINVLNSDKRSSTDRYLNLYQYTFNRFYTRSVSLSFSYRFGNDKLSGARHKSGSEEEQRRAEN